MARKKSSKKSAKKKASKKTQKRASPKTTNKNNDMEKVLIENFIALQKVMTNFSNKFEDLSKQISKLLELFEISAKSLAKKGEKNNEYEKKQNDEIKHKLKDIQDQNKVIARGLTLLHEKEPSDLEQKENFQQKHFNPPSNNPSIPTQNMMHNQQQPQNNMKEIPVPAPPAKEKKDFGNHFDNYQEEYSEEDPFGDSEFNEEESQEDQSIEK